jgi:hypothetical protein
MALRAVAVVTLAALGTLGGSLLSQQPAWACSCAPVRLSQAFAAADTVFIGKVQSVETVVQTAVTTVKVNGVYKGELQPRVKVFTGPPCGMDLEEGSRSVVIFANAATQDAIQRGAQYWMHLCGGTGRFTAEEIERAALGRPVPIGPIESPKSAQGSDGLVIPLLGGLGVIAAILAIIAGKMKVKLHR